MALNGHSVKSAAQEKALRPSRGCVTQSPGPGAELGRGGKRAAGRGFLWKVLSLENQIHQHQGLGKEQINPDLTPAIPEDPTKTLRAVFLRSLQSRSWEKRPAQRPCPLLSIPPPLSDQPPGDWLPVPHPALLPPCPVPVPGIGCRPGGPPPVRRRLGSCRGWRASLFCGVGVAGMSRPSRWGGHPASPRPLELCPPGAPLLLAARTERQTSLW